MNCNDFHQRIGPYVYAPFFSKDSPGRLPVDETREMDEHARVCPSCSATLARIETRQCREVSDTLADYVDGTMPDGERAILEAHFSVCPACVAYLESYQQTIALAKAAIRRGNAPPAETIPEDVIRAVLAARRKIEGLAGR